MIAAAPLPADVRKALLAHDPSWPAEAAVRWSAKTGTARDTGSWLRRAPVFAAVVGDRFALVAAGPRPFVRVLPAAALGRAVYNHVTGELAFPAVATGAAIPSLKLDPLLARSLLDLAHQGERTNA
jgi:hypothetical protein